MNTVNILTVVCAVLFVALIGVIALLCSVETGADRLTRERDEARAERDRLDVKLRHARGQAAGYRAEAQRLAARNAELRDQLDAGSAPAPTLTEEWLAYVADLPTTHPEDLR